MFLYNPQTDDQKEDLILAYQTIIDHPIAGIINLITSGYHYRYYFITRHTKNKIWNAVLNWTDTFEFETSLRGILLYIIVFAVYSYYALCWIPWMLRILINFKKIRQEAPLNLLELG